MKGNNVRKIKKIFALTLTIHLALAAGYVLFEPEALSAAEDTIGVSLTVVSEITLACDATAPLSGTVNAISGGSATGSFSCAVTTPDTAGYSLKVKEDHTLQISGGGSDKEFANHDTNNPLTYDWTDPGATNEIFGFSLDADTVSPVDAYKNNGVDTCGSGSVVDNYCWNGFTTSDQEVANKASAASAETVKINLKAEAGGSNALQPGGYSNTVTATATVNT